MLTISHDWTELLLAGDPINLNGDFLTSGIQVIRLFARLLKPTVLSTQ